MTMEDKFKICDDIEQEELKEITDESIEDLTETVKKEEQKVLLKNTEVEIEQDESRIIENSEEAGS